MRTYDFSPLYRSTIGFDRMLDLLGAQQRQEPQDAGPVYDIERVGEDRYRLTMAVPGFAQDELSIMSEANALLIEGRKRDEGQARNFLHRGIAQNAFRRQFDLADFMKVTSASLERGLLAIELEIELPDAMKPRRIDIGVPSSHERSGETERLQDAG